MFGGDGTVVADDIPRIFGEDGTINIGDVVYEEEGEAETEADCSEERKKTDGSIPEGGFPATREEEFKAKRSSRKTS